MLVTGVSGIICFRIQSIQKQQHIEINVTANHAREWIKDDEKRINKLKKLFNVTNGSTTEQIANCSYDLRDLKNKLLSTSGALSELYKYLKDHDIYKGRIFNEKKYNSIYYKLEEWKTDVEKYNKDMFKDENETEENDNHGETSNTPNADSALEVFDEATKEVDDTLNNYAKVLQESDNTKYSQDIDERLKEGKKILKEYDKNDKSLYNITNISRNIFYVCLVSGIVFIIMFFIVLKQDNKKRNNRSKVG